MRFIKQIFFGILLLVIFSGVAFAGYKVFLEPAPSCTDNRQNGGETGVDCGTVCGKECLPEDLKEVSVRGNIQMIPISTTTNASVLLQVQNLNSDYAAKFDYVLNIEDSSGQVVMSSIGKNYIYAGEIKYLAFPNLSFSKEPRGFTPEFEIKNVEWIKEEKMKKPSIFLQNETTSILPEKVEISGRFTNADVGTLSGATIVGILYDNRGNIIGASQTAVEDIPAGDARVFIISHPFISSVNTSKTKVFVYPFR